MAKIKIRGVEVQTKNTVNGVQRTASIQEPIEINGVTIQEAQANDANSMVEAVKRLRSAVHTATTTGKDVERPQAVVRVKGGAPEVRVTEKVKQGIKKSIEQDRKKQEEEKKKAEKK